MKLCVCVWGGLCGRFDSWPLLIPAVEPWTEHSLLQISVSSSAKRPHRPS